MFLLKKKKTAFEVFIIDKFKIVPKNIKIYQKAFTHKSISSEFNYERLEFLGDAILSSIIVTYLYKNYPQKKEGELTKLAAKIVSRDNLNKVGEELNLLNHIKYVKQQNGHKNLLGNVLEAIIGAVYIDKGYDEVKKMIHKVLLKKYISIEELEKNNQDYKSKLLIWGQRQKVNVRFNSHKFKKQFKSIVFIDDKKIADAEAESIKKAEKKAAEKAVLILAKNKDIKQDNK